MRTENPLIVPTRKGGFTVYSPEAKGEKDLSASPHCLAWFQTQQQACDFVDELLEDESDGDYSQWNEEAEIMRRAENPEISGRDYPPDPHDFEDDFPF